MSVFLLPDDKLRAPSVSLPPVRPAGVASLNSPQAAREPVELQQAAGVKDLHFTPGQADVPVLKGQVDEWHLQGPARTQEEEVCVWMNLNLVLTQRERERVCFKERSSLTWP